MTKYKIPTLPFKQDLETKQILKKVASAHRALAELKGAADTIPNRTILINTLSLQEAKDSLPLKILSQHMTNFTELMH